jgi:hypothetical protein
MANVAIQLPELRLVQKHPLKMFGQILWGMKEVDLFVLLEITILQTDEVYLWLLCQNFF